MPVSGGKQAEGKLCSCPGGKEGVPALAVRWKLETSTPYSPGVPGFCSRKGSPGAMQGEVETGPAGLPQPG